LDELGEGDGIVSEEDEESHEDLLYCKEWEEFPCKLKNFFFVRLEQHSVLSSHSCAIIRHSTWIIIARCIRSIRISSWRLSEHHWVWWQMRTTRVWLLVREVHWIRFRSVLVIRIAVCFFFWNWHK
jgi:hypothetical protein